jgi:hypothetical protein
VDVLKSWCKGLVAFVSKAVTKKIKGFNDMGFEFSVVNKNICYSFAWTLWKG